MNRDTRTIIRIFIMFLVALWCANCVIVAWSRAPSLIHIPDTIDYKLLEADRARWATKCGEAEAKYKQADAEIYFWTQKLVDSEAKRKQQETELNQLKVKLGLVF